MRVINRLPQMAQYLMDASDVPLERKRSLLSAALDEPLDDSIIRFLKLVSERRRTEFFPRMLLAFIELYRKENGIKVGRIVTATHNDELRGRLENIFHDRTGADVRLEEKISPEIIGGFIFELDGYRLDASVGSHLNRLRRKLIEKNNRLV